jgi:XisH protein
MPARDLHHEAVKIALIKDGWRILAEDYTLWYDRDRLYVDLAAKGVTAEKAGRRILVEVKSFLGASFTQNLEQAIGQYVIYRDILEETGSDHQLYLAVPQSTYEKGFQRSLAVMTIRRNRVKQVIVDVQREVIVQWID